MPLKYETRFTDTLMLIWRHEWVKQLCVELKSMKKGNISINEYVLQFKAIVISVGDSISEKDHIVSILDGLPEEYNSFVMQMYGYLEPLILFDVKVSLYVQGARLDKLM